MSSLSLIFAQAQSSAPAGAVGSQMIFFGLLFAAMWFLMIAPQRKKQKAHDKMLSELGNGDEIVTSGGLLGTIVAVKDDRFVVRVSETTKVDLGKSFVASVVKKANS
jgi:preprotein translocase subunit YajC